MYPSHEKIWRDLMMPSSTPSAAQLATKSVRPARREDRARLDSLEWEQQWVQGVYGFARVDALVEHSAYTLVAEDGAGAVIAYATFNTQPDAAVASSKKWRLWLRKVALGLEARPPSAATTLFLTRLVCARDAVPAAAASALTWLFAALPDLERVLHATVGDPAELASLEEAGFLRVSELGARESVLEADREKCVPRLATRPARLEDNDDLCRLFAADETRLRAEFGDFFLARIISDPRPSTCSVVVERDGKAVGMLSVTTEVDLDALNDNFELAPYHGLRQPAPEDEEVETRMAEEVLGVRPGGRGSAVHAVASAPETGATEDPAKGDAAKTDSKQDTAEGENKSDEKCPDGSEAGSRSTSAMKGSKSDVKTDSKSAMNTAADKAGTEQAENQAENSKSDVINPHGLLEGSSKGALLCDEDGQARAGDEQKPILEQLWGREVLAEDFGAPAEEEAPIPDDAQLDGSRPILEMIWGFPVFPDGRVTRKVSATVPGLSSEPVTGPAPRARAVPRYFGPSAAAAVTLCGVREEHRCRTIDLLPAVLERLPDVEYLLLTVPAAEPETELTRLFTRVPHRATSTFPAQLYVFHRGALATGFEVVPARSNQLGDMRALVKHTESGERVMAAVRELFMENASRDSVFTVQCKDQVLGLAVVRPEANLDYVRAHFELEEFVSPQHHDARTGYAHLYHLTLSPVLSRFTGVVLAEVMRLSGASVLLYPVFPPPEENPGDHSLTPALEVMWPVLWRRQIQYPLRQNSLGPNIPKPPILQRQNPVSLQLASRGTVFVRRRRVDARVVVVGGGDAGLAVLERLVFSRELIFTNVTLVEPLGFSADESACLAGDMSTSTENFQAARLATMWLPTWVNLVRGIMESIDRKRKCIRVSGCGEVPYDRLLLTCGLQYQLPKRLVPRPPRPFSDRRPLFPPAELPEAPDNVFRINSRFDAERALEFVRAYCMERTENVIVYGSYLEALTCLGVLIRLPVPAHRLILVLSPDEKGNAVQLTDDPEVDRGIFHHLRYVEQGVRVLERYTLTFWDTKSNNRVYRAHFRGEAEEEPEERFLSCCALFVYDHKGVELVTFKALNDASLVFDGRLVIDHQFDTNDESISAVGTMTKYSRKYCADPFDHVHYNSRDVGHALADRLLRAHGEPAHVRTWLVTRARRRSVLSGQPLTPEFSRPLVTRALLPGGWNYLHVTAPAAALDRTPPVVLATGDPVYPSATGYMRLEVSERRAVQKITCYSVNPIETDNLIALYGLHEVLLNNMVARYQAGMIPDLYSYLRQPWAMMLFHDRFAGLLQDVRQAVLRCHCRDGKLTLEEKIVDNLCRHSELTDAELIGILEDFRTGGVSQMVESGVLQYLANNQYHLPMYAREGTAESLKINRESGSEAVAGVLAG